jgi:hypothetical protein
MKQLLLSLLLFISQLPLSSCTNKHEWEDVKYNSALCIEAIEKNGCISTHQGEHPLNQCHVYIENDTLYIECPAGLPAYWGYTTIKVHKDKFDAIAGGIPFTQGTVSFETLDKSLTLNKQSYIENDTLCAELNIHFKETDNTTKESSYFVIKGYINKVVREKNFNPFLPQNFMLFDKETAITEIGEPLYQEKFNTLALPEFRVELLNIYPACKDILIEELTWNISDTRDISDEGKERLTIWYRYLPENKKIIPVHYKLWNSDWQF